MTPFVEYFLSHSEFSDPGRFESALLELPDDPAEICRVIQGLLIHPSWIPSYEASIDEDRVYSEQQARRVVDIIHNLFTLKDAPLVEPRPAQQRAVGVCRNFSLLLCSTLRCKGVPARLRSGFAPYFDPGYFEDHWICEYWSASGQYWVRVDPQLDAVQRKILNITFDPCDIPVDAYLYAGEAWVMCRKGRADPADFGVRDLNGLGFIKGSIVRDILALNRIETLPWDLGWGILDKHYLSGVDRAELGYVDRLARCSANSLVHLAHSFFNDDDKIRFPEGWALSMAPTIGELMRG